MKKILFSCLFGLSFFGLQGQLSDDFSDGNTTVHPLWFGDAEDFFVNDSFQLQLNVDSGGNSKLCTSIELPDSARWEIYISLRFAPSASNLLRLYLMLDTIDLTIANGYYIEIGQNGSPDPIHFFSLENGTNFLLGSSILAFEKNVNVHLTIIRDGRGTWTFYSDTGDGLVNKVLIINDTSMWPAEGKLLCLECDYTATRSDKFVFDNIKAQKFVRDISPPVLLDAHAIDSITLELIFNENIGHEVTSDLIHIDPDVGDPDTVMTLHHTIRLMYKKEFTSGRKYTCSTSQIPDTANNISGLQEKSFEFIKTSTPLANDLVINEILFDPNSGGSPFIEIYNSSDNFIDCSDIVLSIENKNVFSIFHNSAECIIHPDSFVVFTQDRLATISHYPSNKEGAILEADLPHLSRDFGSIVMRNPSGDIIDSVYYDEEFHHILLDERRGVSLERISPTSPAWSRDDWSSASAQSVWGTPGLPNSQYIRFDSVTTVFRIENKVFSPDGDGHEDFLLLRFSDTASGYLVTARVYDEFGREVSIIFRNELIGAGSIGKWDGTIDFQIIAPTGMYILLIEMMDETGRVKSYKEVVTLATGF